MIQKNTMTKEGYTIRDQTLPHFITATVVDWIDILQEKHIEIQLSSVSIIVSQTKEWFFMAM